MTLLRHLGKMISFYFDEHMPRVVAEGLAARGISVYMAFDAGMSGHDDDSHLRYATDHNAVLFTRDKPFAGRIMNSMDHHAGLICWTGAQDDFGGMVRVLAHFAENQTSDDVVKRVFWVKA